jgi:hypothetical protein
VRRLLGGDSLVERPGVHPSQFFLLNFENVGNVVRVSGRLPSKLRPHLVLHLVTQRRHPALVFDLQIATLIGQLRLDDVLGCGVGPDLLK